MTEKNKDSNLPTEELEREIASYKLENSYIGVMGKMIEPAIEPLGYDWKIGIALISSFAAREVFVGTLSTIYSVGNDDEGTIKQRMAAEINPVTKEKRFNFPAGMSLLVFYAFAMQCMGTLAIVKRETKSWMWPMLQLVGMGLLAYLAAFVTFAIFYIKIRMIQEIVIYILLGIALFFLFSKFWKKIKKKGACDTNCDC